MVKAIVFDVGGVIIPYLDNVIDGYIKRKLGLSEKQFNDLWGKYIDRFITGKVIEKKFWEIIQSEIKRPLPLPRKSLFLEEYCKNLVVNQQVISLVSRLKFNGYTVGVLSNSIFPYSQYNRKIGLYDLFDQVVLSNEVGMLKPSEEIYLYTLNKLRLNPSEVIFIDDKIENVNAAKQVGMKGLKYSSYKELEKALLGFNVLSSGG